MSEDKARERHFEPTKPVGVFLAVFGCVVAGAALFPMPFSDKLINLGSGLFLIAIGAFAYGIGRWRSKKSN
jgi:hypothetical protein